ncbi:MAG: hypothetical protein WDO17_12345 [Alphaproteobacteria bacterium]
MTATNAVRFAIAAMVVFATLAPARAEPALEPARQTPAPDLRTIPPMVFVVAKGESDACGPGCSEWIAADGAIDAGTPQRLRALLAKLQRSGKRTLPIYFYSPGGNVDASLALGRLMRAHKMKAALGRTVPQGCDATATRDKACDALLRSGRELTAELRTNRAVCVSACVYAFIGAAEREVTPGASLSVHSMQITRTMIRKTLEGKILAMSKTKITGDVPSIREAHARVARYAAEMGVGRELVEAAAATPFEKVRVLTRAEIIRFGIDRHEFVQSGWTREANPASGRVGLVKFMIGPDADEPQQYRMSLMRLSCASSRNILVQLARQQSPLAKSRSVAVVVGGNEVVLKPFGKPAVDSKGVETEVRGALAVPAYFESAAKDQSIEIVEEGAAQGGARRRTALSIAGLSPLLKALPEQCY